MRGSPTEWDDDALRVACSIAGGLFKFAKEHSIAYSTVTRRVRKLGLRGEPAKRPTRDKLLAPSFNARPKGPLRLDKNLPVVNNGVKPTICKGYEDTRFKPDPQCDGAGFLSDWKRLRGQP